MRYNFFITRPPQVMPKSYASYLDLKEGFLSQPKITGFLSYSLSSAKHTKSPWFWTGHQNPIQYNTYSADLTACGRLINSAKTSEGPVSAQAEAGFFMPVNTADLSNNLQGGIEKLLKRWSVTKPWVTHWRHTSDRA